MRNNEEIIKLENVSFQYKKKKEVIKNADFSIYKGFLYGVAGKNSVGKSTLLKILCGKISNYQGKIIYHFDNTAGYKSNIGIVTDEEEFIGHLSLINNAKVFGPLYKNFCIENFVSNLKAEEIDENKIFSELSDGEKIKFRIAFALSYKPELLIMDEPAGVLDVQAREKFMQNIRQMATEQNITVIMATHLTADLDKMADYILFINEDGSSMVYDRESLSDNYMLLRGTKEQIDALPQEALIASEESESFFTVMTDRYLKIKEQKAVKEIKTEIPDIETIMYFMDKASVKKNEERTEAGDIKEQKKKENRSKEQTQQIRNEQESHYADLKKAYHRLFDISGRKWLGGIVGFIMLLIWNIILADIESISDIMKIICLFISYDMFFDAIKLPKKIELPSWYHILSWMPVNKKDILKFYLLNAVKCIGIGFIITLIITMIFQNINMLLYYAGFFIAYLGGMVYEAGTLTGSRCFQSRNLEIKNEC